MVYIWCYFFYSVYFQAIKFHESISIREICGSNLSALEKQLYGISNDLGSFVMLN